MAERDTTQGLTPGAWPFRSGRPSKLPLRTAVPRRIGACSMAVRDTPRGLTPGLGRFGHPRRSALAAAADGSAGEAAAVARAELDRARPAAQQPRGERDRLALPAGDRRRPPARRNGGPAAH